MTEGVRSPFSIHPGHRSPGEKLLQAVTIQNGYGHGRPFCGSRVLVYISAENRRSRYYKLMFWMFFRRSHVDRLDGTGNRGESGVAPKFADGAIRHHVANRWPKQSHSTVNAAASADRRAQPSLG
jgi:hypothetical protein